MNCLPITISTEVFAKLRVPSLSCINKTISYVESLIGNVVENVHIFIIFVYIFKMFLISFKICVSHFDQNPIRKEYHMSLQ